MTEIGVRELKAKASEIIYAVREDGARYIVTYRGEPVGVLEPLPGAAGPRESTAPNMPRLEWEALAPALEPLLRRIVREELDTRLAEEIKAPALAENYPISTSETTVWDELMRLGEAIGAGWEVPLSSAELLTEMRR